MIAIYARVKPEVIREEATAAIGKITQWFKDNPKRRVCNAATWYGRQTSIRKNHVAEDINAAAEAAING